MTKLRHYMLLLCASSLLGCATYKRSYGDTHTSVDVKNPAQTYRLDLSRQDLSKLPLPIGQLYELRVLNLSGNTNLNLEKAFAEIPNPEKIEVLILDSLMLKTLPENIRRFSNLSHLSLNENPKLELNVLVKKIASLPIKFLNLQENEITILPENIDQLTQLQGINLSYNRVHKLENYVRLGTLPKLQSLWLTANVIVELPPEIGMLQSLKNLYLEHNKLSRFPDEMRQLKKLWVMHAGHNNFKVLPPEIVQMPSLLLLHINNCEIAEIPEVFASSKFPLMGIILDDNKLSQNDKERWNKEFRSFFLKSFK